MKKTALLSLAIVLLAAGSLLLYSCGKDGSMAPSAGVGEGGGVLGTEALVMDSDIIVTNSTDAR